MKRPAANQTLHAGGVIARAGGQTFVERMRSLDLIEIDLDTEPGPPRHLHPATFDLQRIAREPLPVLPDPMCVDRSDATGSRRSDMCEHGKRNIEMIVGV